jgi:hypothetical protein
MTLKEWIETQATRDTAELLRLATAPGAQTGTTPPNMVARHDPWEKARINNAKRVMTEAGITKVMLQNGEGAQVRAALKAWLNAQAPAEKLLSVVEAGEFFRLAVERVAESYTDADPNEQVDEGSQPIYGPSIAEQNGWVAITGDDIEEAIRQ